MSLRFFRSQHWGWGLLVLLVAATQAALLWLSIRHEQTLQQERLDELNATAAGEFRHQVRLSLDRLQDLIADVPDNERFDAAARTVLRERRELLRIERRDAQQHITHPLASPYRDLPERGLLPRPQQQGEALAACHAARDLGVPRVSGSYHVGSIGGLGAEVVDACVPIIANQQVQGYITATLVLRTLLEQVMTVRELRDHALVMNDPDGSRLATAGPRLDSAEPSTDRLLEAAGFTASLQLRQRRHLPWLPEPAMAIGLTLSFGLLTVLVLLMRDMRRRQAAERELAQALALRHAMEDSLVTGLLLRDLSGRLTYVNPAFCKMVDLPAPALLGRHHPPCLAGSMAPALPPAPSGSPETLQEVMLARRNGEVFPAQLHDAPLLDAQGRHTGWLCAVIDLTAQRRADDLLRQQQEKLQVSARLAMMGEMASLLSHELNQPLTAIVGYAHGTLNMLEQPTTPLDPAEERSLLQLALQRIAEQGDRAGRVIKSVHDFVRRRESTREARRADALIDAVLPLIRLQARRSGASVTVDAPPDGGAAWVRCDPTMIEQVLLNLARNGLQAMEATGTPAEERELSLQVRTVEGPQVRFAVSDRGPGIAPDLAERLFTPFFTTRENGLGLGLNMCRTAIEQHGGTLDFHNRLDASGHCLGVEFHFTLPLWQRSGTGPTRSSQDVDLARP